MTDLDYRQHVFLEACEWVRTAEREVIDAKETLFRSSVRLEFANRGSIEANQLRYEMAEGALQEAIERRGEAEEKYYVGLKDRLCGATIAGLASR